MTTVSSASTARRAKTRRAVTASDLAMEGHDHRLRRDWTAALRSYRRALDAHADCYQAWMGLSATFLAVQDPARASRCLEVARSLRARDAQPISV